MWFEPSLQSAFWAWHCLLLILCVSSTYYFHTYIHPHLVSAHPHLATPSSSYPCVLHHPPSISCPLSQPPPPDSISTHPSSVDLFDGSSVIHSCHLPSHHMAWCLSLGSCLHPQIYHGVMSTHSFPTTHPTPVLYLSIIPSPFYSSV